MSTISQLRAFYREQREALQTLIDTGRDVPIEELARHSRLVSWARRDWQNAMKRERNRATA